MLNDGFIIMNVVLKKVTVLLSGLLFMAKAMFFFSCSDPPKKVFTEKEIEGYWFTDNALHPGRVGEDYFPDSSDVIDFLNLTNSVNGVEDTLYFIKGDTLWYANERVRSDSLRSKMGKKFNKRFLIYFLSANKLILFDLKLKKEVNYYSFYTLPDVTNTDFEYIRYSSYGANSMLLTSKDTCIYSIEGGLPHCGYGITFENNPFADDFFLKNDSAWLRKMQMLGKKINWIGLFGPAKSEDGLPLFPIQISMKSSSGEYKMCITDNTKMPPIRVFNSECERIWRLNTGAIIPRRVPIIHN
jgi:hypothetical protein